MAAAARRDEAPRHTREENRQDESPTRAENAASDSTVESELGELEAILQFEQNAEESEYVDESGCQRVVDLVEKIGRAPSEKTRDGVSGDSDAVLELGGIGQYRFLEKLGQGGMGAVYKALHTRLEKVVALKVLPADRLKDEGAVARFDREMRAVGKLSHPNIVAAHDAGEIDGTHFLVMEMVEGLDLSAMVKRLGPLPIPESCEIIRQAAIGLDHAHSHGMVHRDIKPSNIMLHCPPSSSGRGAGGEGVDPCVKILDMGLALLDEMHSPDAKELTNSGQMMGTLDYMAPEQGSDSHTVDIRADIYSLGATLYKLLTGRAPFGGEKYDTPVKKMMALATEDPEPIDKLRPEIPAALAAIVHRMLARDPDDRFATPAEVAEALRELPGVRAAANQDLASLVSRALDGSQPPTVQHSTATTPQASSAHNDTSRQVTVAPAITVHPSAKAPRRRIPWKPLIATAAVAGIILLGILLTFQTKHGTLIVEIDDPAIEAKITAGELTIKDLKSDRTYTIEPGQTRLPTGQYGLIVRDDAGLQVDTPEFTLRRDEKVTVRVSVKAESGKPKAEKVPGTTEIARPAVTPFEITPEPFDFSVGEPLSPTASVTEPARIEGVQSWTIEPRSIRGGVADMAFSPDGRLLAVVGNRTGMVRVWDANTGELIRVLARNGPSSSLAWSPDSRLLVTCGILWNVSSGRKLRDWGGNPGSYAWSPDGRILAEGTRRGLILRDISSGDVLRELEGHQGGVSCVDWSPDGKRLVSGGSDKTVRFWDAKSGKLEHTFEVEGEATRDVAWSPDGRVVAASTDTQTYLFDGITGEPLKTHTSRMPGSWSLAWSADGKTLLGDVFGQSAVWACDGQTGKELARQEMPRSWRYVRRVACSADGRKFAVAGVWGAVWLWQPADSVFKSNWQQSARVLSSHVGGFWNSSFSADGKVLAFGGYGRNPVRFWETDSGKYIGQVDSSFVFCLAPDGSRFAGLSWDDPQRALVWNTRSAEQLAEIRTEGQITRLRWSPDGAIIAVGTDKNIELRGAASGDLLHTLPEPGSVPFVFSCDGKMLAVAAEGKVHLYHVETAKLLQAMTTADGRFQSPAFSRSERTLAFSPSDRTLAGVLNDTLYLFDVESGKQVEQREGVQSQPLSWYEGGRKLRCGWTHVWDMESNTLLEHSTDAHRISVAGGVSFRSLNGNAFTLRRLSGDKLLRTILALPGEHSAAISPEGHFTGSPGVEKELVYVVQTDEGQETLTPEEFEKKYSWKNDPAKAVGKAESGKPKAE